MNVPDELEVAHAWAGAAVGSDVVSGRRLTGGMTSWISRLDHADGSTSVLRLMTEEPWRRHGSELVAREVWSQQVLAGTPVPAPASLTQAAPTMWPFISFRPAARAHRSAFRSPTAASWRTCSAVSGAPAFLRPT